MLDFLILYESLLESWTTFPFVLHAFAVDDGVAARLEGVGAERLQIHRRPVGQSDLERCIICAPETVFLAETPELWFLDGADLLAPSPEGDNPYAVEAGRLKAPLVRDWLGFADRPGRRVKALRLSGLGHASQRSFRDRIDAVVDRFPQTAPLLVFYATLAKRAALRLGIEVVPNVRAFARERLLEAGVLATRNELPELLNRRGLCEIGAEIGVKRGRFSETILRGWRGRKLISIDTWAALPGEDYVDAANVTQAEHERFYGDTVERLEKFGARSDIWRTTSLEAAARIATASLDFVYLDARHDYDSVKEDLEHWFDKVRPGGVLAGHDYLDGVLPEGVFGVKSAVDEFFGARSLPVKQTYVEGSSGALPASWLVELPKDPGGPLVS